VSAEIYHYQGPDGRHERTRAEVIAAISAAPDAAHHVWKPGWPAWRAWRDVPELAAAGQPPPPPTIAPPPLAGPPPPPAEERYHHHGPDGQVERGLSALCEAIAAAPGASHQLWRPGWPAWKDWRQVPEVAEQLDLPPVVAVERFHYSGPSGQQDATLSDVVAAIRARPHARHLLWRAEWGEWRSWRDVPSVFVAAEASSAAPVAGASSTEASSAVSAPAGAARSGRRSEEAERAPSKKASGSKKRRGRQTARTRRSTYDLEAGLADWPRIAEYQCSTVARKVGDRTDLPYAAARVMVRSFWECIGASLARGQAVRIAAFGGFYTSQIGAYVGHNPKNGAEMHVPEQRLVRFRPYAQLRAIAARERSWDRGRSQLRGEVDPLRNAAYWAPVAARSGGRCSLSGRRALAWQIHQDTRLPLGWTIRMVQALLDTIADGMERGGRNDLGYFQGYIRIFSVKCPAMWTTNPSTLEDMKIPAKRRIRYRVGSRLKAAVAL